MNKLFIRRWIANSQLKPYGRDLFCIKITENRTGTPTRRRQPSLKLLPNLELTVIEFLAQKSSMTTTMLLFMVALWNRETIYIFMLWFVMNIHYHIQCCRWLWQCAHARLRAYSCALIRRKLRSMYFLIELSSIRKQRCVRRRASLLCM